MNGGGSQSVGGGGRARPSVRAAARAYLGRGWRVVPLKPGEKAPDFKAWPELRIQAEVADSHFLPTSNIGILTGQASTVDGRWLVDVDCDAGEAIMAARELLPPTGRVHGRAGKPNSHYWYLVEGAVETAKFADPTGNRGHEWPAHNAQGLKPPAGGASTGPSGPTDCAPAIHDRDDAPRTSMLVELRASGCQTMAPPSVHPCGEVLRWEGPHPPGPSRGSPEPGQPGRVAAGELVGWVGRVAACALLARHWPSEGTRDEAALALCGMLVRGGWDPAEADIFTKLVAKIAGDEEWKQRGKGQQTSRALAAGDPVMGAPSLAERLAGGGADGGHVVGKVRAWLGLGAGATCPSAGFLEVPSGGSTSSPRLESESPVRGALIADVREEVVRWLWGGRIPLGKLTLLDGDPGLGKTLVALDLIARLTTGGEMPDGTPGMSGGAVLLSAEDGAGDTIRPRLAAAGADLARVYAVETVVERDPVSGASRERAFTLPDHIFHLEELIARMQARLVVFDPLMAYLEMRVNSWNDQHMRGTLAPLARLAQRTGAAILILRHLNKGGSTNALCRGGGSIGTIAAARSGLVVAKDPDDPTHCRVLASTKSNLGPPMPALRYRIEAAVEGHPCIAWLGTCAYTADALLNPAERAALAVKEPTAAERAVEWLREALRGGPRAANEVTRAALVAGIAKTTLREARETLGITWERVGSGVGSHLVWNLPADEEDSLLDLVDPLAEATRSPAEGQEEREGGAA